MKHRKTGLVAMLCMCLLLAGCGAPGNPAAPAAPGSDAQPAAQEAAAPAVADFADVQAAAQTGGNAEISASETGGMQAEVAVPEHGMLIHMESMKKEAFDPAEGRTRILTFEWDNVQVDSDVHPDAAQRITEEMALLQDVWYTGSGDGDLYGFNEMLAAAEDNYAITLEYSNMPTELSSTRYITALWADEDILVFLVNSYVYLGGAHGGYASEAVCFDAGTGARLRLDDMSADPAALRERLVSGMLRLVKEDRDGIYAEQLALTEPENYEAALRALLREGSWYPGEDAFHLFSDLYELGPYAAGIADFAVPYESLSGLLDSRWLPPGADGAAGVGMTQLPEIQEGSVDIVDQVVIGDGGETGLIVFYGEARDVAIWTVDVGYDGRFWPDQQLFYCDRMTDCALQMALLFPGDLPNTMVRYRDSEGEHEYLIGLSGEDGRIILIENT